MAIIHHQFESIHPFYDGNGRAGRIINLLYLVLQKKLDTPVLYLSRYINTHKSEYYRLLQTVRKQGTWEEWILYMLRGIKETAEQTINLIEGIRDLSMKFKADIRKNLPKVYSQDLINALFEYPYTKVAIIEARLKCSYPTAVNKLDALAQSGFLEKSKHGRANYYINRQLVDLLTNKPKE